MTMYNDILPKLNDEEICNMAIMAINQAMYLLRRMIENMQQPFVRKQKSGVSVFYGKYDFKMYDK